MIQSKFNFKAYVLIPFIIAFSILIIYLLIHFGEGFSDLGGAIFVLFLFSSMNFISIFFAVKTQKFSTNTNQIFVDGIFGLGATKAYALNDITGYYTGTYSAKANTEIITYLTVQGKKIARLSNGCHKNYKELMAFIEGNLTNLGPVEITFISELKSTINPKYKLKT